MVAVNIRYARWAGVEFQSDLKHPLAPIRLGLVIHEANASGDSRIIVIGRMPRVESRPPGFETTGPTTMEIASKWVDIMAKDAFEEPPDDLFSKLARSWHWNLYVTDLTKIKLASNARLLDQAKTLFEKFVGEPFAAPERPKKTQGAPRVDAPLSLPQDVPPAWMLDEFMRHRLGI